MSFRKKFQRLWNTLKHLRPHQIYGRIWWALKRKLAIYSEIKVPKQLSGNLASRIQFLLHCPDMKSDDLRVGRFTFLGATLSLGSPPDWSRGKESSLLWQFNLHYFHFLRLIVREEQEILCGHWIDSHSRTVGVAWHPYPVSLRIVEWIKAGVQSPKLLHSLYQQAAYLYRNLEDFHPGNHFLENARALVFAGLYFRNQGESEKWLATGCRILMRELPDQVLADGAYFELSPMYHALMLEMVLDLCNILPMGDPLLAYCQKIAPKMLSFLVAATHPDGGIALFNDSTLEIAPPTDSLQAYAKQLRLQPDSLAMVHFRESGYVVHRTPDTYVMIDGGAIGPDYLPAHAHADLFTFELSLKGERAIVDTGVFEYQAGASRDFVRSSQAHNTVTIDGLSQAEMWGSFRVARRFKPQEIRCKADSTALTFSGRFDGWSELIGDKLVHSRVIQLDCEKRQFSVRDVIVGQNQHRVEAFYHIHPDFVVETEGLDRAVLRSKTQEIYLKSNCPIRKESSFYSPRFGERLERTTLRLEASPLAGTQTIEMELNW